MNQAQMQNAAQQFQSGSIEQAKDVLMEFFKKKIPSEKVQKVIDNMKQSTTSEVRDQISSDAKVKEFCGEFFETSESSDRNAVGYVFCCDWLGHCGGISGWLIFLIIILVLGGLAAAGAAFFFFYWRRKMGGRDVKKEEDSEKSSMSSGDDISMGTY